MKRCVHFSHKVSHFHGLGFVIANQNAMKKTLPLRPTKESKLLRKLNSLPKTINEKAKTLIWLSTTAEFHDGFHFLNQKLEFRGICRMLLVKRSNIKPNEKKGTRYYVAKIFSSYKDVNFTAIISQRREPFYFIKARAFKLKP